MSDQNCAALSDQTTSSSAYLLTRSLNVSTWSSEREKSKASREKVCAQSRCLRQQHVALWCFLWRVWWLWWCSGTAGGRKSPSARDLLTCSLTVSVWSSEREKPKRRRRHSKARFCHRDFSPRFSTIPSCNFRGRVYGIKQFSFMVAHTYQRMATTHIWMATSPSHKDRTFAFRVELQVRPQWHVLAPPGATPCWRHVLSVFHPNGSWWHCNGWVVSLCSFQTDCTPVHFWRCSCSVSN